MASYFGNLQHSNGTLMHNIITSCLWALLLMVPLTAHAQGGVRRSAPSSGDTLANAVEGRIIVGGGAWRIVLSSGGDLRECRPLDVNDSLLRFERLGWTWAVPVDSIALLVKQQDAHPGKGAGTGLLYGMGIGLLLGSVFTAAGGSSSGMNLSGLAILATAAAGAAGGAIIGVTASAMAGSDERYQLSGSVHGEKVKTIRMALIEDKTKRVEERRREETEQQARERRAEVQQQQAADQLIRTDPEPLSIATAEYPETARMAGVTGTVFVKVVVGIDGLPKSAEVLKGIGAGCDEAARSAALKSIFKPGTSRGKPVESPITIPFMLP